MKYLTLRSSLVKSSYNGGIFPPKLQSDSVVSGVKEGRESTLPIVAVLLLFHDVIILIVKQFN